MLNAVRLLFIWLSFSLLQACTEAIPEISDLDSSGYDGLAALLSSVPANSSNQTIFYGAVSGAGVIEYRYKYGESGSVDCADPVGYSSVDVIANPPYIDISGFADGPMKICALGGDGVDWQTEAYATVVTWTKDTLSPTVIISSAVASPTNTSPLPITINFSEPMIDFVSSDLAASNATISGFTSVDSSTFTANIVPSSDGTVVVSLSASMATDSAGNGNIAATGLSWNYDGTAPTLTSISIPVSDGAYGVSTNFSIQLVYDEAVTVSGSVPYLMVEAGTADAQANYTTGSGTNTLTFMYTVSAADYNLDLDLVAGSQLFTNGAAISDAFGNAVSTALPIGSATSGSLSFNQDIVVVGNPASLAISDSPNYDYGVLATGASAVHVFTINNNGGVTATGMSPNGLATPFAFVGGTYPGTGGTCGPALAPSASCTIAVMFAPIFNGVANDTITIDYDNGLTTTSADRSVSGIGTSPASLTISESGTYNFGSTPAAGAGVTHTFTITNSGGVDATGISESGLVSPFVFDGGYPGAGGTCGATLAAASNCSIVVRFAPDIIYNYFTGQITIDYNNGVAPTISTRMLEGSGSPEVLPVYGTTMGDSFSNWNRYIRYDNDAGGTHVNNQNLELCDGSETGPYNELGGCIHSGERRKVIFHGRTSCFNLSLTEANGAFEWICDDSSGTATFYSVGFKPGRGMRDLLMTFPTVDWATNNVSLYDGASLIGVSQSTSWWSNPLLELGTVTNSTVVNIDIPEMIYYVRNNLNISRILLRGAGRWSLVTLGGAEIVSHATPSADWCDSTNGGLSLPDSDPLFCSDSGSLTPMFGWIEVDFSGAGYKKSGFIARQWRSMRVHNSHMRSFNVTGGNYASGAMAMIDATGNMVTGLESFRLNGGVKMYNSSYNTFKKVDLIRSQTNDAGGQTAIGLYGASNYNRFYDTTVAASANISSGTVYGLVVEGQYNNFAGLKISNLQTTGAGTGIVLSGGAHNNTFTEVLLSGLGDSVYMSNADNNLFAFSTITGGVGAATYVTGTSGGNTFMSLAAVNNWSSITTNVSGSVSSVNRFINSAFSTLETPGTGYLVQTNGSGNSYFSFQGYMLRNSSDICAGNEANVSGSCVPTGPVDYPISFTPWESSSFIGSVSTDDIYNTYDSSGSATESAINSAVGWMVFDSPYRVWGNSGFFGSTVRGPVNTGTARIWDFMPYYNGTLSNKSYSGGTINNTITYTGTSCATNTVDNVRIMHAYSSGTISFLKNAIEINDDIIGNNNGLCEDGESCTYAPHIGGAQGFGGRTSGYCTVSGGIKIYGRITY